jgi:hypothetical protein
MLHQVVGSVFQLMNEYEAIWQARESSENVDLFGFRYDVGLDPIQVNVPRMLAKFRHGCQDLGEIWSVALRKDTMAGVAALARERDDRSFHLDDELWVKVIYDFAASYRRGKLDRGHLMRSLTPLYMARVASFVLETEALGPEEVDARIEGLCRAYEEAKPYLMANWRGVAPAAKPSRRSAAGERVNEKEVHHD